MVELIGIEDVMELLGCGRPMATRLLRSPGCPTLPRKKNAPYLVPKEPFIDWVNGGCKKK